MAHRQIGFYSSRVTSGSEIVTKTSKALDQRATLASNVESAELARHSRVETHGNSSEVPKYEVEALGLTAGKLWNMSPTQPPCNVLECDRKRAYEAILFEAIQVLEATKKSFKSKQLAELRNRILEVLQKNR